MLTLRFVVCMFGIQSIIDKVGGGGGGGGGRKSRYFIYLHLSIW